MSFLDDAISGIKERINIAVNNTFVSSFIITWCFHNWKVFLYTFSTDPKLGLEARFVGIDSIVTNYWNILCFPFLIALVSTLGYPWLKVAVRFYNLFVLNKEKLITIKSSNKQPISQEEAFTLKEKNNELEEKVNNFSKQTIKLQDRIDSIKIEVKDFLFDQGIDEYNFTNLTIPSKFHSNLDNIDIEYLKTQNIDDLRKYSIFKRSARFSEFKKLTKKVKLKQHIYSFDINNDDNDKFMRDYLAQNLLINNPSDLTLTEKGIVFFHLAQRENAS